MRTVRRPGCDTQGTQGSAGNGPDPSPLRIAIAGGPGRTGESSGAEAHRPEAGSGRPVTARGHETVRFSGRTPTLLRRRPPREVPVPPLLDVDCPDRPFECGARSAD